MAGCLLPHCPSALMDMSVSQEERDRGDAVEVERHVWVVHRDGGRPQWRRESRRRRKTEGRCEFKGTNEEKEKYFAKIGRPIAAAAAACLPLTACSCEPVLGMTANGSPGTLAEHSLQSGLRYICNIVQTPPPFPIPTKNPPYTQC